MIYEFKAILSESVTFQKILLEYIDQKGEKENEEKYNNLIDFINKNEFRINKSKFMELLRILSQLAGYHFRGNDLLIKINKILQEIFKDFNSHIKDVSELFNIFKYNKTILLFLLQNIAQISIGPNCKELLLFHILNSEDKELIQFFYPEIRDLSNSAAEAEQTTETEESTTFDYSKFKDLFAQKVQEFKLEKFIAENDQNLDFFNERRNEGENEAKVAQLIRNDNLDEFIEYVNSNKIKLNSKIRSDSPFETNTYLFDREPILLEYSAFFGSLKIFNHLIQNIKKDEIKPKILSYSVHGCNYEIIHQLEELFGLSKDATKYLPNLKDCFLESIRCHHNEIASYIQSTYLKDVALKYIETSISACNFILIENAFNLESNRHLLEDKKEIQNLFNCFCANGYINFVELLLNQPDLIDINAKDSIRFKKIFFYFSNQIDGIFFIDINLILLFILP